MSRPALERFARPLERFEAIRRQAMRLGDRVCDLSYANPQPGVSQAVKDAIRGALEDPAAGFQYSPNGGHTRVRRAVADGLRARLGLPFAYDDVVLTPGATAALHLALRAAGKPGDEVLVPTPCWLDYPLYVRSLGLRPVPVRLKGPSFQLDPETLRAAVTPRTCALLLSHPANPTGRVYDRATLAGLADALWRAEAGRDRPITWISDEVHRDFAPPGTFGTPAAVWPRTLIVYSYGKYHALQGQRAGYVSVSPSHPRRAATAADLVRWARIGGFGAPTALMQHALPRLDALRHDLDRLHAWRARYRRALVGAGYRVVPSEGTFFLYVAIPDGWKNDFAFVRALARDHVLVMPGAVFHDCGHVRLSLTATDAALARALSILCESRRMAA